MLSLRKYKSIRSTLITPENKTLMKIQKTLKKKAKSQTNSLSNQPLMLDLTLLTLSHTMNLFSRTCKGTSWLNSQSRIHARTAQSHFSSILHNPKWMLKWPHIADLFQELSSKLSRFTGRLPITQMLICLRTLCSSLRLCLYPQIWT